METTKPATPARIYRSRHPERTVLYRAFAQHFERFLLVYEEHFQEKHGYLRRCVEPAVHRYLDCGIFDQGVARVRCPDCRHDFLIAFSCKLRSLCPSCHQKRELLWADWADEELLNFHPHVHVLVTDGGFRPDGTFQPLVWFDSRHVERLFRGEVLRRLLDKELIFEAVVDNLLSWRHSGFSAHGAVCVQDREGAVRLGRYMIRCPIVLERLAWDEGAGQVVCRHSAT